MRRTVWRFGRSCRACSICRSSRSNTRPRSRSASTGGWRFRVSTTSPSRWSTSSRVSTRPRIWLPATDWRRSTGSASWTSPAYAARIIRPCSRFWPLTSTASGFSTTKRRANASSPSCAATCASTTATWTGAIHTIRRIPASPSSSMRWAPGNTVPRCASPTRRVRSSTDSPGGRSTIFTSPATTVAPRSTSSRSRAPYTPGSGPPTPSPDTGGPAAPRG